MPLKMRRVRFFRSVQSHMSASMLCRGARRIRLLPGQSIAQPVPLIIFGSVTVESEQTWREVSQSSIPGAPGTARQSDFPIFEAPSAAADSAYTASQKVAAEVANPLVEDGQKLVPALGRTFSAARPS